MIERTEENIKKNWKALQLPLVSIICMTYNHELYISETIEGFLIQETTFPFEIIIHDDASTDGTTEIIKKYAQKYPTLIKPIFQKENQFSKQGVKLLITTATYAEGNYIALCEGDDLWIDKQKLEIQFNEMQSHPQCDISFHPAIRSYANKKKPDKIICKYSSNNKIFPVHEMILEDGGFCPTASLFIHKNIFHCIPDWYFNSPIGDYFLQLLASLKGGCLYINKVMSIYRIETPGSWSIQMKEDENHAYQYSIKILRAFDDMNTFTENKFKKEFEFKKNKVCFFTCINPVISFEKRKKFFIQNKNNLNFMQKIAYLICINTNLCKFILNLRRYILDYLF